MSPLINRHRTSIAEECRKYGVRRLELFGSAARGDFAPGKSDFDFVATFSETTTGGYADRYLDFAEALERLLGHRVDLLTERSIRNPYFARAVDAARQVVYDGRG
ncbi:MAG: nucleotidyltransferase domain-containing protein [Verrucomicrobiota bacterium]|nr:nucleotidyltransferase domain-containing protein [Verrucomicrobiota bacterium]